MTKESMPSGLSIKRLVPAKLAACLGLLSKCVETASQTLQQNWKAFTDELHQLGWQDLQSNSPNFGFNAEQVEEPFARMYTILKFKLKAPKSNYGYHGGRQKDLEKFKTHGLDNSKGDSRIDDPDFPFHRLGPKTKVSLTCDLDYARDFGSPDGIILRTKVDNPTPKHKIISHDNVIPPHALEISSDHGHCWQALVN